MRKGRLDRNYEVQRFKNRTGVSAIPDKTREVANYWRAAPQVQILLPLVNLQTVELYAFDAIQFQEMVDRDITMLVDIIHRAAGPCDADVELAIRHEPLLRHWKFRHVDIGSVDYLIVRQAQCEGQ